MDRVEIPEHQTGIRYYCTDLDCTINFRLRGPWHENLICPRCHARMTALSPVEARRLMTEAAIKFCY